MNVEAVTLFFALLALLSQFGLAFALGTRLFARGLSDALAEAVRPLAPWFAFAVASTCTAGSLYLSEVAGFKPCRLCWYQRGFMYPLVLVTLVWAIRPSRIVHWLLRIIPLLGAVVSSYHILIENFPNLETGSCDPDNPCSLIWVRQLGYITIPTMALTGFLLIAASAWVRPLPRETT